jgi:hypothetical protein
MFLEYIYLTIASSNFLFKKFFFYNNFFFKNFLNTQLHLKYYSNIPKSYLYSVLSKTFSERFFFKKKNYLNITYFF